MNVALNTNRTRIDGESPGDRPRSRQPGPGSPGREEPIRVSIQVPLPGLDRSRQSTSRMASQPPEQPPPRYSVESYTRTIRPLTGMMVAVARRILGDEVQAWDAVQEALISLWLEGEMPRNPRAWLTRAVVLRSLHQARSRARRRRHERRACERRPEPSDRDDPSRQMEYEELTRTSDEILRAIPPDSREVILLRMAAQMEYAEIADTLQIPIGTVRSRLSRIRQVFRVALSRSLFP